MEIRHVLECRYCKCVHVLLAQNESGELIIGDSHHYGRTIAPFDSEEVNELIMNYLFEFTELRNLKIIEWWQGIYPKMKGNIDVILKPEQNVTIVTGLGSAGMTLSFGLAEEVIDQL